MEVVYKKFKRFRSQSKTAVIYIVEDGFDITKETTKIWKKTINDLIKIKGIRVISEIKMGITHVITANDNIMALDAGLKNSPLPYFVNREWIIKLIERLKECSENDHISTLITELTEKYKYNIKEDGIDEITANSDSANQNNQTSRSLRLEDSKIKIIGSGTHQKKDILKSMINHHCEKSSNNADIVGDIFGSDVGGMNSHGVVMPMFDLEKLARDDNYSTTPTFDQFLADKRKPFAFSKDQRLKEPMKDKNTKLVVELFLEMSKFCALDTTNHLTAEYRSITYKYQASYYKKYGLSENNLMHFGVNCADKICEILSTGTFQKLVIEKEKPDNYYRLELSKVHGIGPGIAGRLIKNYGVKSIDDLKQLIENEDTKDVLSYAQKVGLKYYEDIQKRIPRPEVEAITKMVNDSVGNALGLEKAPTNLLCTTVGSYRRGKEFTGDVDIIIKFPEYLEAQDTEYNTPYKLLFKIIKHLNEIDILKESLSLSEDGNSSKKKRYKATYMGIIKLPKYEYYRRIDIKIYHEKIYCFGVLHFTGDAYFNRSIRAWAQESNYSLSDDGIAYTSGRGKNRTYGERGSYNCKTERDILGFFNIPFYEPKDRALLDN